jgi:hypothetical protein
VVSRHPFEASHGTHDAPPTRSSFRRARCDVAINYPRCDQEARRRVDAGTDSCPGSRIFKKDAELPGGDQIEFLPTNEKQRGHIRPTVQPLYQCPRTSNSRCDNILVVVTRTFGGPFRSGTGPPPPWPFRSPPHHGQPDCWGIKYPDHILE